MANTQPLYVKYAHVALNNGVLLTVKTDIKVLVEEDQVVVVLNNHRNPVTGRFLRYVDRPDHVTSLDKDKGHWIIQKIDMRRIEVLNQHTRSAEREKLLEEMRSLQDRVVDLGKKLGDLGIRLDSI